MAQPLRIDELNEKLRASGRIEGSHAMQLRRIIYANGTVNHEAAKLLLGLDRACSKKDPAFAQLYVEALTDYFVWQTEPKGYVSPESARLLIDNIGADGHIESKTELELVLNIVHWARQCPEEVVLLVLDAVRQSVLLSREYPARRQPPAHQHRRWRRRDSAQGAACAGGRRQPAGHAARGGIALYTERCDGSGRQRSGVDRLSSRARSPTICSTRRSAPVVPTREDAARRERWLNERGSIGQLLGSVGKALAHGNIPMRTLFEELDPPGAAADEKAAEAEARATKELLEQETINSAEAAWLAKRILQDDTIDENERALLAFLKKEAKAIDPSLKPLFARAKI